MAQPEFVPVIERDRVHVGQDLPNPDRWSPDRVGDLKQDGAQPAGAQLGVAGPDQGYALKLARHLTPRLVVGPGSAESVDDVIAGCLGIALKRAALYGRAPVIFDLELAFGLWGYLDGLPPADLVAFRGPIFAGVSHHYSDRRAVADMVAEETLRLKPAEVVAQVAAGGWRALLAP